MMEGSLLEDSSAIVFKLAIVFLLIFFNAFFVAAEFAIVKMRSSRLETLIQEGNKRASYAKSLIDHVDVALSVTQLGITLASLGLGWLGEPVVAVLIGPLLRLLGIVGTLGDTIAFILGFTLITAFQIVLGELIPKNVAIRQVERIMLGVALPLLIFERIMYPFVWLLNHVANWVAGRMGFEVTSGGDAAHTEDEIRILMEESHKQGYIDKTELDFVDNVFDFSELSVREIMIPRTDMICLYLEDSIEENIATALKMHPTRYPICGEDKDDIIGFLHIKDLLTALYTGRKPNLRKLARKALVVPETMAVSRLLKMMQKNRSQLAIVVDEYGGTAGMVTIEDIVEEIVGDIQDEFDHERPLVEQRGHRLYSADAKMLLEELEDVLEVDIAAENVDTLGGWLYAQVESPPRVGQKAVYEGTEFFVEEVDHVRITRVLIRLAQDLQEEHEEIVHLKENV